MVMGRLRNFASRKRASKVFPTPNPASSSRHSLEKSTAANNSPALVGQPSFPPPGNQAAQDIIRATTQTSNMSTQTDNMSIQTEDMSTQLNNNMPTQTSSMITQTRSDASPPSSRTMDIKNKAANKQAPKKTAKKAAKKAAAAKHLQDLASQALAMVNTVAASGDAVMGSGLAVSQNLNETAREILEAKTSVSRMDSEITQLTNHMEMMELRFNSAHVQFNKARALHHTVLDHNSVPVIRHKEKALANMAASAKGIQQFVVDEGVEVSEWPIEKIHVILSVCSSTYSTTCSHRLLTFMITTVEGQPASQAE